MCPLQVRQAGMEGEHLEAKRSVHLLANSNLLGVSYSSSLQVRQAEMEGEYLEAKRQLLRTREKNLQVRGVG